MTTTDTSLTMPASAEAASRYQRLRSHLAALKLHAAAEALPTVLDAAAAEQLSLTVALERLLAIEVDADQQNVGGRLQVAAGGEFIDELAVHPGGGVDVEALQGGRGGQAGEPQPAG